MAADHVVMPDDYRCLLAESGPGTLAGVLRLLAPGGPEGFAMEAGQASLLTLGEDLGLWQVGDGHGDDARVLAGARLWGVFTTGESCWWLPVRDDPARWLVVIAGHGWQQLNIPAAEFLRRWAGGLLDLPVLAQGAVPREWHITPAGLPVAVPEVPDAARDPLAQLKTVVGAGLATSASFDWAAIEAGLGRPLPPDYKLLHETYGRDALVWNGINVPAPLALKKTHELHASHGAFTPVSAPAYPDFPAAGDLLLCCTTEGRDLLAWDTRNPDPARWPVINMEFAGPAVFPGTLTELLVAELTGAGLGLTYSRPGDPAGWAYPFWGPDAPWESQPGNS